MAARFELGVILPNYGDHAGRDAVARVAEAAEELGFDSIWATEHLLVGAEAASRFNRTLDALGTLAWLAARTERVRLGTSIVILPLHHPVRLAKEAATLQELSGGRFALGIGVGWHEDEFRFLSAGFEDRGRRADEAIALLRTLWRGGTAFDGTYWSFADAMFGPLPESPPEIWIGGGSARALRRARELGDVWHPTGIEPDAVARAKERWPDLRIVPRIQASDVAAFEAAGADGAVVSFGLDPDRAVEAMRRLR